MACPESRNLRGARPEEDPLSTQASASPSPSTGVLHCAGCGSPLAADQRYCLECGARNPHAGGALLGDLRALAAAPHAANGAAPHAANGAAPAATRPGGEPPRSANTTAVIAGVGVLLLSMGVGVLIGRASSPTVKAAPAQVISVATPAAGSAPGALTTPTTAPSTPTPTASGSAAKHSSTTHGSHKAAPKEAESSTGEPSGGVGQVPSKPAPPAAAEHKHGESGQSYEQKSKNIPNVVSTG
jgi:hypothetical protein